MSDRITVINAGFAPHSVAGIPAGGITHAERTKRGGVRLTQDGKTILIDNRHALHALVAFLNAEDRA